MMEGDIAYLILAHEQPGQLRRLISALLETNGRIYIHLDASVDRCDFQGGVLDDSRVWFVEDRVRVVWQGYSMVEATLRLLTAAVRHSSSRFVLLSGADYPLANNSVLMAQLKKPGVEYLTTWALADRPEWMSKVAYHYPIDWISIRGWAMGNEAAWWKRFFWGRFHQYRNLFRVREFPRGMQPFGGSQWWALTRECVQYILTTVSSNPQIVRFFKTTASPDEMFFHTIIMNSSFAGRVHRVNEQEGCFDSSVKVFGPSREWLGNLRYADWSDPAASPRVLDASDFIPVITSGCLFGRKFHESRSSKLLDCLDVYRAQ